jgi:RES domain
MVPAGTRLIRIYRTGRHGPTDFNRRVLVPPDGGRFDTLDPAYGHLYAAHSPAGAVAEALLRGRGGPSAANRILPRATLTNRAMAEVELLKSTTVVSLRGPDIGQVCQDAWLTKCESDGYPITRLWGVAIRGWAPTHGGFIWWARRDEHELALVFYDDRIPTADLRVIGTPKPLDHGPGFDLVVAILAQHNVTVA